jgi:6-phosphogluconate dehydrogenase
MVFRQPFTTVPLPLPRSLWRSGQRVRTSHDTYSIEEFVKSLARPRKILIMVKAGAPVDAVIAQLKPFLEPGDMIIDGGNSLYKDTERRTKELEDANFGFVGMGVSGGEEGALNGPSLMPGGTDTAYGELAPILTKLLLRWMMALCYLHRSWWCGSLRQDGTQRD